MSPSPRVSIPADAPPRPCDEQIARALVRSSPPRNADLPLIHLLPALPTDWPAGHALDLRACDITIEIKWSDARITRATLVADRTMTVAVKLMKAPPITLTLPEGEPLTVNAPHHL